MAMSNDYKTKEQDEQNSFTDVDALLFELSSKYAIKERTTFEIDPKPQVSKPKPMLIVTLSDSEEDSDNNGSSNKYLNLNAEPTKTLNFVSVYDSDDEASKTKITKKSPKLSFQGMTKEEKAAAKRTTQEEKRVQRIFQKAEDLKAKEMKKKLNQASKNLKPDDYMNQIEVVICDSLYGKPMSKEIFNLLNENNIKYLKTSQIYSNSITWNRTKQYHKIDDEELITTTKTEDCEFILFILECDDLMTMIVKDELIEHFKTVKETMRSKVITLGIFAVNEYFRGSKNQRKRTFKNNICGTKSKAKESELLDRNSIETYLTKLQILLSICYKYLDTAHDVAALVNHMTKAIAQTPYKLKRNEQMEQAQNYMIGDNKDCVLVDKNGHGLSRLWQQNITSFPIARLDLAEAIMATYPTFNSLMQAYESCDNFTASEKLLENLEIRRTAGPLTNFRKIGPEFSKKMFRYYNSRDPDMLL